jgi:Spy/CpxP family protein refolding chaperone
MKKLLIPVSFCLFALSTVTAQEKGDIQDQKHSSKNHQKIAEKLNLTEEQKVKMKLIQQDFREQSKSLKSNDNLTLGKFKKQMQSLKEQRKSQISTLLTDEQKAKMKEGREHKMKENAKARFQNLKTELQLTADQQVAVKKNQKKLGQLMKEIHQNQALTQDQKKEQFATLKKQREAYLKSVLSPAQTQKFESMKAAKK